jgi:hypothetical protein
MVMANRRFPSMQEVEQAQAQSCMTTTMMKGRRRADGSDDHMLHPKHQQAQAFLHAFAGVLSPVWFACLLEGCHEEKHLRQQSFA